VTVLNPDGTARGGGTARASQYGWVYLHQGGRLEVSTGLYYFRAREYSPALGRWLQVDPTGYAAGDSNLYRDEDNGPTNAVDPRGLSNAGAHHPYPLMLGGADATQPLFGLEEAQHSAAESVFRKYGVGNYYTKAGNDAARARWAAMSPEKHRAIITESLRAAEVPESLIKSNIDKIMEGAQPGKNCVTLTRASTRGRVITRAVIQQAAKLGKLATALGGVVIFSGVSYAYNKYVEVGEAGGTKLATKAALMFELRRARNSGELPSHSFLIKWGDGVVKVQYESTREGKWITAVRVTLNERGRMTDIHDYLIKPGDLPLDFMPGDPLTP
jgi:RHS repeat-associated protein